MGGGFVQRFGLRQARALVDLRERIRQNGLAWLRLVIVDTHGLTRCKTVPITQLDSVLSNGVRFVNTLLLKDTACKTAWPVFSKGGGMGDIRFEGAGDVIAVPDPASFKVLPWVDKTGWLLCDLFMPDGSRCPWDTRAMLQGAVDALLQKSMRYQVGLEVEFHVYRLLDTQLGVSQAAWPAKPPEVAHTEVGYQMLSELRADTAQQVLGPLLDALQAMQCPVLSVEAEFGPSQYELVFDVQEGLAAADCMMLLRSAAKQILRRHGYHATFMCKPVFPQSMASGWHLHQSLSDLSGRNLFTPGDPDPANPLQHHLSVLGAQFLAGLLAHAPAYAAMATPTINGYERYQKANVLAPNQVVWGIDNRGALLRVIGAAGDKACRIENRLGEPAANPYLTMATQIYAGLDGINRSMIPPPASSDPYAQPTGDDVVLPKSLQQALQALSNSTLMRQQLGDAVVDWYTHIKQQEVQRYDGTPDWQHQEYFLFY
jgi:glutamine synthetase